MLNDVPELYDWVRPGYPDELFADLAGIAGIAGSGVRYQPGEPLAGNARVCSLTAVESARGMAALARHRTAQAVRLWSIPDHASRARSPARPEIPVVPCL